MDWRRRSGSRCARDGRSPLVLMIMVKLMLPILVAMLEGRSIVGTTMRWRFERRGVVMRSEALNLVEKFEIRGSGWVG